MRSHDTSGGGTDDHYKGLEDYRPTVRLLIRGYMGFFLVRVPWGERERVKGWRENEHSHALHVCSQR